LFAGWLASKSKGGDRFEEKGKLSSLVMNVIVSWLVKNEYVT
jgi:hypothetical protein